MQIMNRKRGAHRIPMLNQCQRNRGKIPVTAKEDPMYSRSSALASTRRRPRFVIDRIIEKTVSLDQNGPEQTRRQGDEETRRQGEPSQAA